MSYYFSKTVNEKFDTAIEKFTDELKKEGFGVLTQIDVQDTLKKSWMSILENTGYSERAIRTLYTKH